MPKRTQPLVANMAPETAELNHAVFTAIAHDLGGIAGALDLRASALAHIIPEADGLALHTLSDQVRLANRGVRLVRGPSDGGDLLMPSRTQSLEEWWALTSGFTNVVLPRGVGVEVRWDTVHRLSAPRAASLTWVWLAACKELVEIGIAVPCTVSLRGAGLGEDIVLTAELPGDRVVLKNGSQRQSRWRRYAEQVAGGQGMSMQGWKKVDDLTQWRCALAAQ